MSRTQSLVPWVSNASFDTSWPLVTIVVLVAFLAAAVFLFGGWMYIGVLVAIALLVRWPVPLSLGLLALSVPFDNVSAIGQEATGVAVTRYIALLTTVVLLAVGLVRRRLSVPPRSALWWTIFTLWGAATYGWAIDKQLAWDRVPTAALLLLLYLVATSFQLNEKELSGVTLLAIVGGCCASAIAVWQFFGGTSFSGTMRASLVIGGRETDPNHFACSLLLPCSLAIGVLLLERGRLIKIGAIFAIGIIGLAILLSMSRGGLIAAGVVVFVYLYHMKLNPRALLLIGLLVALLAFMPQSFFQRVALADRGAGRFDIWIAGLSLLPRYGLIGAGWNNFVAAYLSVAGNAPHFHGFTEGAHNIYLGLTVEVGIVGLIFLITAFRSQLRRLRDVRVLPYQAACAGMLMMGLTLDIAFRKSFWLCWILLAMATRLWETRPGEEAQQ